MYKRPIRQFLRLTEMYTNTLASKNVHLHIHRNIWIQRTVSPLYTCVLNNHKWTCRSFATHTKDTSATNSDLTFTPIFKHKYVVHLKVFSRLKIYQTAFTLVAVPLAVNLYVNNGVSMETLQVSLGLAGLACTMLYVISLTIMKVIGVLSLSNNGEKVRVSRLSFWGKRIDSVYDVSDVIPLADMSESSSQYFLRFRRYSSKKELWLFLHHGEITDMQKLEHIVGSLK